MDRQLLDYHPTWIQKYKEIQVTSQIEQEEIEKLVNEIDAIWNNNFLDTLDVNGCQRWEKMLEITSIEQDLESRRSVIASRVTELRPFTINSLYKMLEHICSDHGYYARLDPPNFILNVKVDPLYIRSVRELLKRIVPANIIVVTSDLNTYSSLREFTYGEFKNLDYTYEKLRKAVLEHE